MHPAAAGNFPALNNTYLDTASYGIPPLQTANALRAALDTWAAGTANWVADWDPAGDRCREYAAAIFGAPAREIALIPAVSVGVAVALTGIKHGDEILLPDDEFASVLLPSLVIAKERGATIRYADFAGLASAVSPTTTLVATSHVRSNDGRTQDLAALSRAARSVGAAVLVDATHSAGILTLDAEGLGLDFVVAAAYKHLLCPRGVAFLRVAASRWDTTAPIAASWRSTAAPYDNYYGQDLSDLSPTAARFDVSLAWHAWVGAEASLSFLSSVPAPDRREWCVGLANDLASRLKIPATGSSVLTVPVPDGRQAREALRREGIIASGHGKRVRLSFHLYNDSEDVGKAVQVLMPFVAGRN